MSSRRRESRNGSHVGTSGTNGTTTRRSWTGNGMYFTMETTTYSSDGASFGAFGGETRASIRRNNQNRSAAGNGVLGAAFGLLGDVLAAQQQQTHRPAPADCSSARRQRSDGLAATDDLAFEANDTNNLFAPRASRRRGGLASRLADRLARKQREQTAARSKARPSSPWPRAADSSDECTDGDSQSDSDSESSYDSKESFGRPRPQMQASNTTKVKDDRTAGRGSSPSARPQTRRQRTRSDFGSARSMHTSFGPEFDAFFNQRRTTHQTFAGTTAFDPFASFGETPFAQFERLFSEGSSFAGMQRDSTSSRTGARSRAQPFARTQASQGTRSFQSARPTQAPRSTTAPNNFFAPQPTPTPRPPPNVLRSAEAKQLFKTYNDRWNTLDITDPGVPYPCRSMQARDLAARDVIWAPLVCMPIATWSNETIMQANVQALYLGAVGLVPQYTEAPATKRILMAYDKKGATPEQVQQLMEILKKEKTRWHSDRLGRRNGGASSGPNEKLQQDERARAVFHAVCELMEVAS